MTALNKVIDNMRLVETSSSSSVDEKEVPPSSSFGWSDFPLIQSGFDDNEPEQQPHYIATDISDQSDENDTISRQWSMLSSSQAGSDDMSLYGEDITLQPSMDNASAVSSAGIPVSSSSSTTMEEEEEVILVALKTEDDDRPSNSKMLQQQAQERYAQTTSVLHEFGTF